MTEDKAIASPNIGCRPTRIGPQDSGRLFATHARNDSMSAVFAGTYHPALRPTIITLLVHQVQGEQVAVAEVARQVVHHNKDHQQ